jgi:SAM-dependent methyltransferase
LCRTLRDAGASDIVGVDVSARMLETARSGGAHGITYVQAAIEDYTAPVDTFDLVVSSLALHYVQDFGEMCRRIARWLRPSGEFVFSTEHPIATAAQGIHPGWIRNEAGEKAYWAVDCYHDEGRRESCWFVDGVVKYHRTAATILNALLDAGLVIRRVLEPHALEEAEAARPCLRDERRRPPFLLVKAERTERICR